MSEQQGNDENESNSDKKMQVHVPPDLDYFYRDICNVFVGAGEVILEFGNFHRAMPGHATITNRIVLSVQNAYELHNSLGQSLADAQKQMQEQFKQRQQQSK